MTVADYEPRLDFDSLAPRFSKLLSSLQTESESARLGGALEPNLRDLVRLRASQINGCAYCVDMHSKDLLTAGEADQRVYSLVVWREVPFYSEREQAALEFTEAVTVLTDGHVPADLYARTAKHFSDAEMAGLVAVIVVINAWTRIGVATRCWEPGSYQVG